MIQIRTIIMKTKIFNIKIKKKINDEQQKFQQIEESDNHT